MKYVVVVVVQGLRVFRPHQTGSEAPLVVPELYGPQGNREGDAEVYKNIRGRDEKGQPRQLIM
eukprot:14433971-Alexandrium_andersonii.AAC.1